MKNGVIEAQNMKIFKEEVEVMLTVRPHKNIIQVNRLPSKLI